MSSIKEDNPVAASPARILVVEDSSLIARKIEQVLLQAGYEVVGPAPTLKVALSKLQFELNAAVLDIDLRGEAVYPLAERLQELGTPFMFLTGFHELAYRIAGKELRCSKSRSRTMSSWRLSQDWQRARYRPKDRKHRAYRSARLKPSRSSGKAGT
jgi:CheY-like chemotaxis protein